MDTDRWLVTTAIGGDYRAKWEQWAQPFWVRYAERHGFGIAVVTHNLFRPDEPQLNGSWQKLLAPRALRELLGRDVSCAMWDTDLLPSPVAPSIFDVVSRGRIGVVSQEHGLPGDAEQLRKRIAFLRQRYLDGDFPLWSALNASPQQRFLWAGLPAKSDFFCAGMYVVDTASHADLMVDWYLNAPTTLDYQSFSSDEIWFNVMAQTAGICEWLPYEWHALWIFEVAALYPFLYAPEVNPEVAGWCLASSLTRNHIVHLAGRWESLLLEGLPPTYPGVPDTIELIEMMNRHEASAETPVPLGKRQPPGRGRMDYRD